MSKAEDSRVIIGVAAAFILWYFVFLTDLLVSFWYRVTLASITLAFYAYSGSSRLSISWRKRRTSWSWRMRFTPAPKARWIVPSVNIICASR